ncbi:MAG TPA: chemotaxis protein CheW [Anaeromyxobacteraceae bacterium]|nr:chemotaxis protein CheW [Anaeromyxobacteraceae bacterium]
MKPAPPSSRYAVFGAGPHLVGVPASVVEEIFVLPAIHHSPGLPPHWRGVANVRGSALPALDLRICLGLVSASSDLEALLTLLRDREQDHRNWLSELDASVRERRKFTLATDPRKCKFGQWYYAFKSEDAVLRGELAKIEQPHSAIHALAGQVGALEAAGQHERALDLIERARRGLLSDLLQLFEQIRRAVQDQHREIGVAAVLGGRRSVLIVDRAEAVADLERIADADDPLASGELQADLVSRMARWKGAAQPVMLLDLDRIAAVAA